MGSKQDQSTVDFLNEGLDARTEYRFYWKRNVLYISFYIGETRRQRTCSILYPEVVDTTFRAEARRVAQEIVLTERDGRVQEFDLEKDRVQTGAKLEELVEAWKKEQPEAYPDSFKTRLIQISNVAKVIKACAPPVDLKPIELIADDRGPQLFVNARMRQCTKETVVKEVGILFHFLEWAKLKQFISEIPKRPAYRKKDRGVRVGPQRSAPVHLSDIVALRIISLLPEYARKGGRYEDGAKLPSSAFVCRDWMRFAFEVSLRPSTVSRLVMDEHWRRGWRYILVTPDIDKGGNVAQRGKPRRVPLTEVAYQILTKHAPKNGVIFGKHDIRVQWKRAAIEVLGEDEGGRCSPYDLRHGANFRMRSTVGGSLGGAMHMTGHALASTNDLYMVGSEEEAKELVKRLNARNADLEKQLGR